MIVVRPDVGERIQLDEAQVELDVGLVGDNWLVRGSSKTEDGKAHPEAQITLMNTRVIDLLAGSRDRWELAGDQIYVDMDLSERNTPPGSRLRIGDALLEITAKPHTGCAKFRDRFGQPAALWVNSEVGTDLKARGLNAKVITAGTMRVGDVAVVM